MSTLADNIVKSVDDALKVTGAFDEVTYNSTPAPTIDYETGVVTQTPTTGTVKMNFGGYRNDEVDGVKIMSSDRWATIAKPDLLDDNDAVISPSSRDTITKDSVTEEIVSVGEIANGSKWKFQLRKVGDVDG